MPDAPMIYLSNWSSHKTPGHHGPGRKFSMMAWPRQWERGDGTVYMFVPREDDLRHVRSGAMAWETYAQKCREVFAMRLMRDDRHERGKLAAMTPDLSTITLVDDGDTICCACANAGPCHRQVVAEFMRDAGWRVVLDGKEFE